MKPCEAVVTPVGASGRYGRYSVADMRRIDLRPFASLTGGEIVEADELLFLDTETTGLAGGAGTVAFLVGVGHFAGDGFVVKQYLMRDFDEEGSLLAQVAQELAARCALVTYNGKAFDMNLLRGRFIMDRRRMPEPDGHIDLLHVVRRIWNGVLENCRLSTAEGELLGARREGDVPGSLIPQIYFQFLESKDRGALEPILEHNRRDILAMAGLLRHVSGIMRAVSRAAPQATPCAAAPAPSQGAAAQSLPTTAPPSTATQASPWTAPAPRLGHGYSLCARELLGLSSLHESLGDAAAAERCLLMCVRRSAGQVAGGGSLGSGGVNLGSGAASRRALMRLAEMKRRQGDHASAARYWQAALDAAPAPAPAPASAPASGLLPCVELAKHFEHRARDLHKALEYTERAIAIASAAAAAAPPFRDGRLNAALAARRDRLLRKLAKHRFQRGS